MYENGKRISGHAKERLHKRKMKKRYAKKYSWGNSCREWEILEIEYQDMVLDSRYHPLNYWRDYYLSDMRKIAKKATSRRIRRTMNQATEEDYLILRGADYRKYFDYDWFIW